MCTHPLFSTKSETLGNVLPRVYVECFIIESSLLLCYIILSFIRSAAQCSTVKCKENEKKLDQQKIFRIISWI